MTNGATNCLIDGFGPVPIMRPSTIAALSEHVCRAAAEGLAVYSLGGGTQLDYGRSPERKGVALETRGLSQVIDFPARDMTITVQAGITVADLQNAVAPENLRLPVDVPQADRVTLGGAVATNTSGSRRYGFGTLRDYVIGISALNDSGNEIKAGGRVVKNVAGYDLCKLFVGSFGTLGLITQLTLKLRPCAEERALVVVQCATERLPALLDQLHTSRTQPTCLDLLNAEAARYIDSQAPSNLRCGDWVAVVGFEGNRVAVEWQVQRLVHEVSSTHGVDVDVRIGVVGDPLWRALTELPGTDSAACSFKANIVPSAAARFCTQADHDGWLLHAHAGNGIVWGHAPHGMSAASVTAALNAWLQEAAQAQGNVVVRRCPFSWKRTLPVWGHPRRDLWLMCSVKQQLDPRGLFNPGRFVDGI
jgi:glycolate oxidase FAD binding subunit